MASRGLPYGRAALEAQAEREISNVGDAGLGEWREWSGYALHIKRRLTPSEELEVGPVCDIRGSDEARRRAQRLGKLLRQVPPGILADEVGVR